jgi:hypothetical protein
MLLAVALDEYLGQLSPSNVLDEDLLFGFGRGTVLGQYRFQRADSGEVIPNLGDRATVADRVGVSDSVVVLFGLSRACGGCYIVASASSVVGSSFVWNSLSTSVITISRARALRLFTC